MSAVDNWQSSGDRGGREVLPNHGLPVLRSRNLSNVRGVRHGITCRVSGLGQADGNVAYSAPRNREDAWSMRQLWCTAIGVDPGGLVTLGQIHGAEVIQVRSHDAGTGARPDTGIVGYGDSLITAEPGVGLMTLHADCMTILIVDPDKPAIAAVHAGWRGTVADVAGATVRAMNRAFATKPERLLAFMGPAIEPCCYQVGAEVADAWERIASPATTALSTDGDRWRFNLRAANLDRLLSAGLAPDRVESATICTRCTGETWFSHRGQGPLTGRFGAIISLED